MGAWGSDRIVLSITLFPSNMNKMRAEAKKGMDGLMADALWQSKRHESSTAKKMRGRKEGRKREGDFPSCCSFHVRRADTNTKRSLGFQKVTSTLRTFPG